MSDGPYNAMPIAPFVVPALGAFDTSQSNNPPTSTVVGDAFGIVQIDNGAVSASPDAARVRFSWQTPPAAPYTITLAMDALMAGGAYGNGSAGIALRNSATGRLFTWGLAIGGSGIYFSRRLGAESKRWASYTSPSTAGPFFETRGNRANWFRMANNGVTLTWAFSPNGIDWVSSKVSEPLASYIVNVDQIGFYTNTSTNAPTTTYSTFLRVASWSVT